MGSGLACETAEAGSAQRAGRCQTAKPLQLLEDFTAENHVVVMELQHLRGQRWGCKGCGFARFQWHLDDHNSYSLGVSSAVFVRVQNQTQKQVAGQKHSAILLINYLVFEKSFSDKG